MIELLTADEVCARLRISTRTLRNLKNTGAVPYVVVSARRILYRASDIDAYVESRVVTTPSAEGRRTQLSARSHQRPIKSFSQHMEEKRALKQRQAQRRS